jgi:hypothetical protein
MDNSYGAWCHFLVDEDRIEQYASPMRVLWAHSDSEPGHYPEEKTDTYGRNVLLIDIYSDVWKVRAITKE